MTKFHCVQCGQALEVSDQLQGADVECPSCNGKVTVPHLPAQAPSQAAGPNIVSGLPQLGQFPGQAAQGEIAEWVAPTKKCRTFCPACDYSILSKDVSIPGRATCPKCSHEYTVARVIYPSLPFLGFAVAAILSSLIIAYLAASATVEKGAREAMLSDGSADSLFPGNFIVWSFIVLIPLALFVAAIAYYGCEGSRRDMKLSNGTAIMGGATTLGWIVAVPYLICGLVVGSSALKNQKSLTEEQKHQRVGEARVAEDRRESAPPTLRPNSRGAAIAATMTPVVARIQLADGQGTGFTITPDGNIVTNYHVIEKSAVGHVTFGNGEKMKIVDVLISDPARDLAIIKVDTGGKSTPFIELAKAPIQQGADVYTMGSPQGLDFSFSSGTVSSTNRGEYFFQMTCPISPGSSGSPVVNSHGRLVGIASFQLDQREAPNAQNLNFAVHVSELLDLIARLLDSLGR